MEDNDDGEQEWMQTGGVIMIKGEEDRKKIFVNTGITDRTLQTRILDTETRTVAINELNEEQFKQLQKNLENNKTNTNINFLLKSLQPRIKRTNKEKQQQAKLAQAVKPVEVAEQQTAPPPVALAAPVEAPVALAAPVAVAVAAPVEVAPAPVAQPEYQIVQIQIQSKHDLLQETISLLTHQTFAKTYTAVLDQPTERGKYQGQITEDSLTPATKLKACKYYLYNTQNKKYYYLPDTELSDPPP
jgi:hypothetical protein